MARIVRIAFHWHHPTLVDDSVAWEPSKNAQARFQLPQLVWADGTPFREANAWALQRSGGGTAQATVDSSMSKLLSYANFLESNDLHFLHFPLTKSDRCLVRYRGHLIACRDNGDIAPSEASARMRVAVSFYRFAQAEGLLDADLPLWRERQLTLATFDPMGFERTIRVRSTDLAIPNRRRHGVTLEGGLRPLSELAVTELMALARAAAPEEYLLMIRIGLETGLRIGTIADLKVETLNNAARDPRAPGQLHLNIGPGAKPAVATKFSITGGVLMSAQLHHDLLSYSTSVRRLTRQQRAATGRADLLFLTSRGAPYSQPGSDSSTALRTLAKQIRRAALAVGNAELSKFHFHQTRATFGTRLLATLLAAGHSENVALAFVQRAMFHRDPATTWRYLQFTKETPLKRDAADAFTRDFLGKAQ